MGRNGFCFPLLLAVSSHHTLLLCISVSEQCRFLRLQILIPLTPWRDCWRQRWLVGANMSLNHPLIRVKYLVLLSEKGSYQALVVPP